ncbi:flagellar biosynthesis protein FlhF [Alteromonas aestuariivivens]|uniref:Flagellar biosynthesis protein FlhF n=1 Tax=Alteromonas aestuariivivens TaxID=1938339 RepID=A0A3D8M5Q7_9ALTE|nr:flagellar biosynthesis protein FlhF [Alteromonas aestuariivivens]RDV25083.1 flagellar biosynthesis protein FlhF [Alteromonas aestuariivivens]
MKIRRFFGKDMREALSLVKAELGSDAVIMSNRKVADGIELVAAYDKEPEAKLSMKSAGAATPAPKAAKPVPSLSEIIGDDGPDSLMALLEKQSEAASRVNEPSASTSIHPQAQSQAPQPAAGYAAAQNHQSDSLFNFEDSAEPSFAQPAPAVNQAPQTDLSAIQAELASLRSVLQHQVADLMEAKHQRQKPMHRYLTTCLTDMGISGKLAEQLVSYTPVDSNEREAWVYLLNLLANRVNVTGNDILTQSGVVALVGPTGTGKTTTVAKLAARYAQKYGAEQVAMITIDTYRIAAFEQLATYGKIIGCTVRKAQSSEELAEQLFQLRHKRLILIDTAGFSQRDSRLIQQLAQFNNGQMQPVKRYLVMQSNTQYPAMQRIIEAYQSVKLEGCIFTKLDECYSLGEVLSAAIEYQLPVSYVTDGQKVPEDIKVAEAKSLVSAAARLYKKYGLTHTSGNQVVNAARAV